MCSKISMSYPSSYKIFFQIILGIFAGFCFLVSFLFPNTTCQIVFTKRANNGVTCPEIATSDLASQAFFLTRPHEGGSAVTAGLVYAGFGGTFIFFISKSFLIVQIYHLLHAEVPEHLIIWGFTRAPPVTRTRFSRLHDKPPFQAQRHVGNPIQATNPGRHTFHIL